jgi:hypothetical protein
MTGSRWGTVCRTGTRLTYGVLLPSVAVYVLIAAGLALPAAVRAGYGEGLSGTFVAQVQHCGRYGCSWDGTFMSRDGSVRLEDVVLDADAPRRAGDRVATLYEGQTDPPQVYLAEGSRAWTWNLVALLMSAGYLAGGGWWLLRGRRTAAVAGRHSTGPVSARRPVPVSDGPAMGSDVGVRTSTPSERTPHE